MLLPSRRAFFLFRLRSTAEKTSAIERLWSSQANVLDHDRKGRVPRVGISLDKCLATTRIVCHSGPHPPGTRTASATITIRQPVTPFSIFQLRFPTTWDGPGVAATRVETGRRHQHLLTTCHPLRATLDVGEADRQGVLAPFLFSFCWGTLCIFDTAVSTAASPFSEATM